MLRYWDTEDFVHLHYIEKEEDLILVGVTSL